MKFKFSPKQQSCLGNWPLSQISNPNVSVGSGERAYLAGTGGDSDTLQWHNTESCARTNVRLVNLEGP